MTNAELIAMIKAEIERRFREYNKDSNHHLQAAEDAELLDFLSTLESEKPVPNDLEEAADEYEKKHTYQRYDGGGLTPEYDATLTEAFIAGYNLCKEKMMKEAVVYVAEPETPIGNILMPFIRIDHSVLSRYGIKVGDKVRIIVIPNTDKK